MPRRPRSDRSARKRPKREGRSAGQEARTRLARGLRKNPEEPPGPGEAGSQGHRGRVGRRVGRRPWELRPGHLGRLLHRRHEQTAQALIFSPVPPVTRASPRGGCEWATPAGRRLRGPHPDPYSPGCEPPVLPSPQRQLPSWFPARLRCLYRACIRARAQRRCRPRR
jgi:hypothetical protein